MFKTCIAAVSLLALSGTALASGNESFNLGDFFFAEHATAFGDDPILVTEFSPTPNPKAIVGIRISFDYDEVNANGGPDLDASWASDLGAVLRFDNTLYGFGGSFRNLGALAGGYTNADAINFVDFYDIWDFNGSGSTAPGSYTHEYMFDNPIAKPDLITVSLTDTWDGNTLYAGFTIELIKIPAPASAGLLGFAGLVATRRRR